MLLRHDRPDRDCIVADAAWPAVVTFFGGDGAGTLIADRWLLSAAHTARNIPPEHRVAVGGHRVRIARVVAHPDALDLALVELEAPVSEGDSGGPAIVRTAHALAIAGVSSWQDHSGPLGAYGCVEHYARVSPQVAWIRAVTGC